MRLMYAAMIFVAVLLALSPYVLLRQEDLSRFEGKVVSYNVYGSKVKSIDPATCGDTTSSGIQGSIYEGPYAYHFLKRPVEVITELAESMPAVSEDGRTYTIRLRKGVKYSRNACFGLDAARRPKTRTVRAEDFVLAFKRIADFHLDAELAWSLIRGRITGLDDYRRETQRYKVDDFSRYDLEVAGVTAVDEHTLRIKLAKPFPQLLYVLAMHLYAPIPREVVDYYLKPGGKPEIHDPKAIVGTGPYMLTEWVRGGKIILERNPDYRGDVYPAEGAPGDREAGLLADAGKPVPFVDAVYLTYVEEDNPAWMLFMTKQRDTAGIPVEVYQSVVTPSKELTDAFREQGIRLYKEPYPAIYWFVFNMDDPVVGASKSLRQALCLAYDVETHIEVLINGRGKRAVNVVPSTFDGHRAVEIGGRKYGGASPYARLDLAAAKKKFELAKKELVEAGAVEAGEAIPPLVLDLPGRDTYYRRMGEFAQGQFKKLGLTVKVELNDWPTLQKKVRKKQCQIYTMGWHADYPDAENFLQLYYSPNIKAGTNNSNFSNAEFDKLYERASVMMPSTTRTRLYARAVDILNEHCPVLLLSEPVSFFLVQPWVHNVKPHPVGYGFRKCIRIDVEARAKAGGR
jgi:ABC-type transport system substrate-binding protein